LSASLTLLSSPLLAAVPGVVHGFSTRHGGVSLPPYDSLNLGGASVEGDEPDNVARNRLRLARALGLQALVGLKQVHGREVRRAREVGPDTCGDAVLVEEPGVGALVRVADCAPVLLARRDGTAACAVHAGWRGAVARVASAAVEALGTVDLVAAVGPCIGPCCFQVGPEVVEAAVVVAGPAVVVDHPAGGKAVDLAGLVVADLVAAGVPCGRVDVLRACTACHAHLFSHRRDRGRTGRQAGVVALVGHPRR
jgi:hypothetical protein